MMAEKLIKDNLTGIPVYSTKDTWYSHEGKLFHSSAFVPALSNGAIAEFLLVAPSNTNIYIEFAAIAGGACKVEVLEDVTASALGTTVTTIDLNRVTKNSCETAIYASPTNATGTVISTVPIAGGQHVVAKSGGLVRDQVEWVLCCNNKYMMRVTNISGSDVFLGGISDHREI
jgi:hypothetical protein